MNVEVIKSAIRFTAEAVSHMSTISDRLVDEIYEAWSKKYSDVTSEE